MKRRVSSLESYSFSPYTISRTTCEVLPWKKEKYVFQEESLKYPELSPKLKFQLTLAQIFAEWFKLFAHSKL